MYKGAMTWAAQGYLWEHVRLVPETIEEFNQLVDWKSLYLRRSDPICAIQTNQLTKSTAITGGIDKLNLTVQQGRLFGFIRLTGPANLPLSTLLGLIKPTSGSAQVLGLEVGRQQGQIPPPGGLPAIQAQFYAGMTATTYSIICWSKRPGLPFRCRRLSDRLQLNKDGGRPTVSG